MTFALSGCYVFGLKKKKKVYEGPCTPDVSLDN